MVARPGPPPPQPPEQRNRYLSFVPGQVEPAQTPFEALGAAAGLVFAWLRGSNRFSYLFRPVAPVASPFAAALGLVVTPDCAELWLFEQRFVAAPQAAQPRIVADPLLPAVMCMDEGNFVVLPEPPPSSRGYDGLASQHASEVEAVAASCEYAHAHGCRAVVGYLLADLPWR
jgi:hypothetical protein